MQVSRAFVAAALAAFVGAMAAPATAQSGPSFNCRKARTFVELEICRSPSLSAKDRRMASQYRSRLNWLKSEGEYQDAADLQNDQRLWLARRDRCRTNGCLHQAYDQRIVELDQTWD